MATDQVRTFCRLCEVGCGLTATVVDGALTRVRPDHDHPVTRGFACSKGLRSVEVHTDPDRLRAPLKRGGDEFVATSWDRALADIAGRLNGLIDRFGPRSVGIYLGNPNAFNALGSAAGMMLARSLETDRLFSAVTQDCSNKYAVDEILYGTIGAHPIPDLDRTDLLLVIGSNVRVSKSSFLSMADPVARIRSIGERGGRVVFVDPLQVEPDVGEALQLRPDTDPYLLAALLHEIHRTTGFTLGAFEGRVTGVDDVLAFVAPYSPEAVAPIVGVSAATITQLAHDLASARGASIHASTGLNMGRQGALAYWLVQMLLLLTGNLDRPGGSYFAARAFPAAPSGSDRSSASFESTPWGPFRRSVGMVPSALLPELIAAPDEPLRALIVLAGNPLRSIGGGDRLRAAFESLDLLVSVDLYRNATGELADYVLPATDQFEREDINVFVQGVQTDPFVQWTPRVVEATGQQLEEWRIVGRLLQAMGRSPMIDPDLADPVPMMFDGALGPAGLSVAELREHLVVELAEPGPGASAARLGLEGPIECVPEALRSTLERGHLVFEDLRGEGAQAFKMITRRTQRNLNSWLTNLPSRNADDDAVNPLWMNPGDAADLGARPGDRVRVSNPYGALEATVRTDPRLRSSVVAMTHGYGAEPTPGMPQSAKRPGVNVNALAPSGPGTFDPVSGMSHVTGIPVDIVCCDRPPT